MKHTNVKRAVIYNLVYYVILMDNMEEFVVFVKMDIN